MQARVVRLQRPRHGRQRIRVQWRPCLKRRRLPCKTPFSLIQAAAKVVAFAAPHVPRAYTRALSTCAAKLTQIKKLPPASGSSFAAPLTDVDAQVEQERGLEPPAHNRSTKDRWRSPRPRSRPDPRTRASGVCRVGGWHSQRNQENHPPENIPYRYPKTNRVENPRAPMGEVHVVL